jgi:hypothetical protein
VLKPRQGGRTSKRRGFILIRRGNWRTIVSTAKVDRRRRTLALTDDLRAVPTEWREMLLASAAAGKAV